MNDKALTEYLEAMEREVRNINMLTTNKSIGTRIQTLYTIIATVKTDIRLNINKGD